MGEKVAHVTVLLSPHSDSRPMPLACYETPKPRPFPVGWEKSVTVLVSHASRR